MESSGDVEPRGTGGRRSARSRGEEASGGGCARDPASSGYVHSSGSLCGGRGGRGSSSSGGASRMGPGPDVCERGARKRGSGERGAGRGASPKEDEGGAVAVAVSVAVSVCVSPPPPPRARPGPRRAERRANAKLAEDRSRTRARGRVGPSTSVAVAVAVERIERREAVDEGARLSSRSAASGGSGGSGRGALGDGLEGAAGLCHFPQGVLPGSAAQVRFAESEAASRQQRRGGREV